MTRFLPEQIMKETDFHQASKKGGGGGSEKASNATTNNDSAAVDGKEGSKSKKVGKDLLFGHSFHDSGKNYKIILISNSCSNVRVS